MGLTVPGSGDSLKMLAGNRLLTKDNLLIPPPLNYLSQWYDASQPTGTLQTLATPTTTLTSLTAWYTDAGGSATTERRQASTNVRGSFCYRTALANTGSAGEVFMQTPTFQLAANDVGKAVTFSMEFANTNADDTFYDVIVVRYDASGVFQELIAPTGMASTITGTAGVRVAPGNTTLRSSFVSNSSTTARYSLRIRRRTTATAIDFATITVGPQTQLAGAPVTDWQSYTPTVSNLGAGGASVNLGYWRRIGDSAEIRVHFVKDGTPGSGSSPVTFTLPSGLTVDSTKARIVSNAQLTGFGGSYSLEASAQYHPAVPVLVSTGTAFQILDNGGNATYTGADFRAGAEVSVTILAPIANWSSNVTMADRAVEEYASNFSTTVTSDTLSFAYGSNGSATPSGVAAAGFSKTVRFNTPIQATDLLVLEVQRSGQQWAPLAAQDGGAGLMPYVIQNGAIYGMGINFQSISGTDVQVQFGRYFYANSTYGAAGSDWSSLANFRWRVRKVSSGAAVGYPVDRTNITYAGVGNGLFYEEGSFTGTLTGLTTTPTATIQYVRTGKTVTLFLPTTSGTSNSTAFTVTGVPPAIRPATDQSLVTRVVDNGTVVAALVELGSAGTLAFYTSQNGAGFTSSGSKGLARTTLTYLLV